MRDFQPVIEQCVARFREGSDAVRLFHGRGHSYPGYEDLTVDLFPPCLVVRSYGDDEPGVMKLAGLLSERLAGLQGICVQLRDGRRTQTRIASGSVPDQLTVTQGALRFIVRPMRNQNVGLFLDMAPARDWLHKHSSGAAVLNLFAYTCAFSVAAVAGGATRVVNNDMSRSALDWGVENHRENQHDPRVAGMLAKNLFKSWSKIRQLGPYDVVVIDPPTNQRGSFNAEKQYGQILKRIPEFTRAGGSVLACLNSPFLNTDFLPSQMSRWCAGCEFVEYLRASEDFPDRFSDRALKVAVFRYSG
jgi:23S rRNA (cytosine1962-C5)-methyltransferase